MWVGSCVTALATWASPPRRRRNSVHRSVKMASRRRFGAFVYTVAPWAWVVGGLGIVIVYTNGRIGPLRAGLGRLCTLLRCRGQTRGHNSVHKSPKTSSPHRIGAFVYTVGLLWTDVGTQECTQIGGNGPLGAVSGHLCTLLRRESRHESRRELRQVARAPQPPRRAGGAPSLAPLAWSGRQALREWRRCQAGIFAEASTHTNP